MMIVLVDKNGILQGEGYYMFMYMYVDILYMSFSIHTSRDPLIVTLA